MATVYTVYSVAGDADGGGQSNNTIRVIYPSAQLTNTDYTSTRVTLYAASGEALQIGVMYIGNKAGSGDAYDFADTPVQVTFDGGAASKALAIGANGVSDWVNFKIAAGADIIISFYVSGNGTNDGFRAQTGETGFLSYYKAGNDASTVNATGYSALSADVSRAVLKIEATTTTGQVMIF